jgi:Mn2+/Fe2+ NRAMP family transporter
MFPTLLCIWRSRWVLAASALLVVAAILAVTAAGLPGHPAVTMSAHLDLWAALSKLIALRPHW